MMNLADSPLTASISPPMAPLSGSNCRSTPNLGASSAAAAKAPLMGTCRMRETIMANTLRARIDGCEVTTRGDSDLPPNPIELWHVKERLRDPHLIQHSPSYLVDMSRGQQTLAFPIPLNHPVCLISHFNISSRLCMIIGRLRSLTRSIRSVNELQPSYTASEDDPRMLDCHIKARSFQCKLFSG